MAELTDIRETVRVDVVISNCVINLAGDKPRVLQRGREGAEVRWAARGFRRDPFCAVERRVRSDRDS